MDSQNIATISLLTNFIAEQQRLAAEQSAVHNKLIEHLIETNKKLQDENLKMVTGYQPPVAPTVQTLSSPPKPAAAPQADDPNRYIRTPVTDDDFGNF